MFKKLFQNVSPKSKTNTIVSDKVNQLIDIKSAADEKFRRLPEKVKAQYTWDLINADTNHNDDPDGIEELRLSRQEKIQYVIDVNSSLDKNFASLPEAEQVKVALQVLGITLTHEENTENEEVLNATLLTPRTTTQTAITDYTSRVFDTSWQVVGHSKKRKTAESPENPPANITKKPVATSNRFLLLSGTNVDSVGSNANDNANDPERNTNSSYQTNGNENKKPRPPPIFIHNVALISGLMKTVETIIGKKDFRTTVLSNNTVRVNVPAEDDYRLLVRELRKAKIEFYTFQLKTERAFKVVIRQIHSSVQPDEIKSALEEIGFNCRNVTNIRHWRTKEPLPLFFIELEPDDKSKEIYQLHSLLHMQIKVEAPRPHKIITQCHRCQRFGHTKAYCTLPEVCVKCGENHAWDKCPKLREDKPRCGLCGGEHTANYKGCSEYKKVQAARSKQQPKERNAVRGTEPDAQPNGEPPALRRRLPDRTYTEATKSRNEGALTHREEDASTATSRIEVLLTKLISQNETLMQLLQTVILKLVDEQR